ncbi:MAG TPA: hypothetical protein VF163_14465 [Micromonosporaceae bacterium]
MTERTASSAASDSAPSLGPAMSAVPAPSTVSALSAVLAQVPIATDETVALGPVTVRIVSDCAPFPALRYFSRAAFRPCGVKPADFEIWCVSPARIPESFDLAAMSDVTARAASFRAGYYVTDHFGDPVIVVSRDRLICVVGERLEHVLWPYFVKYLLLRYAVTSGSLFLKAAAVATGATATLVIGRGGAGKTVMANALCHGGAGYITNSHALLRDGMVLGVASSMRMRRGPWLDALDVPTSPALNPTEAVVDPADAYGRLHTEPVPVGAVVLADFRSVDRHVITALPVEVAHACLEQFGLGLNVYRLEEDLLDLFGGDITRFASAYLDMTGRLRALAHSVPSYYVSSDLTRRSNRAELLGLVAGAEPISDRGVHERHVAGEQSPPHQRRGPA